jgi:hypothetical protein
MFPFKKKQVPCIIATLYIVFSEKFYYVEFLDLVVKFKVNAKKLIPIIYLFFFKVMLKYSLLFELESSDKFFFVN